MVNEVTVVFLILLFAKTGVELWLDGLNRAQVRRYADAPPEALKEVMPEAAYRRSVDYTLARNRFGVAETIWSAIVLAAVIFSGVLPWFYNLVVGSGAISVWREGLFFVAILILLSLPGLPFEWWSQFRLEERFGFNKTTLKLWITDRIKGLAVGILIGYPLICLLLALVGWGGDYWWVWAFLVFFVFQLVMMVLYPMLIMPLFNKFSPLPEGELRQRLMDLADRTGFKAKTIQVMDGSRRSTHSNAFFTGFGRFRRIVLFDTLIEQLDKPELEAVLAHEIGHYKKGHIPRMLALSAVMVLIGFWAIAWLADSAWFYQGFGFDPEASGLAPAFLLFALLSGLVTFWLSPLFNLMSRKHEYEADAFARDAVGDAAPLIGALRKLSEKNLSNLTPHPLFSAVHYSHPTLVERETSLRQA